MPEVPRLFDVLVGRVPSALKPALRGPAPARHASTDALLAAPPSPWLRPPRPRIDFGPPKLDTRPSPIAVATPGLMRDVARGWHADGASIGLVPTMGALHAGHMSLVERARRENDRWGGCVFVNPIQFFAGEDLSEYPRSPERDLSLLPAAGVDAIYIPSVADMYPPAAITRVIVHGVTERLEGAQRPGHFEGVATVVTKLFTATSADRGAFAPKAAQQVAVVMPLAADLAIVL